LPVFETSLIRVHPWPTPSVFSPRSICNKIGLDGTVIADPIRRDRVVAQEPKPKYVTFINPQPDKGVAVFARIAIELKQRRPDIPLLVVEGRGMSDALANLSVDVSGLTNLKGMANTPDPRDFYKVTRAVLMPSLWRESVGRVPIEAMANGIPVLASDRGALPETLGDAGFVFTILERCTPSTCKLPTAHEACSHKWSRDQPCNPSHLLHSQLYRLCGFHDPL
jgi:glycosyltransferase involved in cell wall biosynthesis